MSDHLSKQFDLDLENIRTRILQMGGLVESQISAVFETFSAGRFEELQRIVERDTEVDGFEVGIDEDCTLLIARRQPTARDLRLIMAISRMVTDLERIGDKAAKIANMAQQIHREAGQRLPFLPDVRYEGKLAIDILQGALDSLARMDGEAAHALIGADKEIDATFNAIVRQLITYMVEDPRTISEALRVIWIAKAIERVGDHAVNIAENVIYIVSGTDVRHAAAMRKKTESR